MYIPALVDVYLQHGAYISPASWKYISTKWVLYT